MEVNVFHIEESYASRKLLSSWQLWTDIGDNVTVTELKCEDEEVTEEARWKVKESSYVVKELDKFLKLTNEKPSLKLEDPRQRKKELVKHGLEESKQLIGDCWWFFNY